MSESFKLTLLAIGGLILFFGGLVFLVAVLRDRVGRPLTDADFGEDDDEEEEPESGEDAGKEEETIDFTGASSRTKEEPVKESSEPEPEKEEPAEESSEESAEESLEGEDLETLFTELFEGKSEEAFQEEARQAEQNVKEKAVYLDDMLDSEFMLGKTAKECGVPASCVSKERGEILTEGLLFGKYSYGGVKLEGEGEEEPHGVSYYVICHELSFEECKVELSKIYGKTIASGEQSYGDSTSVYCAWQADDGVLWLSFDDSMDCINLNLVWDEKRT